jgi:nitrate/nitrite-specific signal transduction histidine kinase
MEQKSAIVGTKVKKVLPLILMYAMAGVLISLYSITIYSYVRMQFNDNARINAAGRLRMLTQKITKDVVLFRDGAPVKSSIEQSVIVFHATIFGITQGGSVPLDETMTMSSRLPAIDDPESRNRLEDVIRQWVPFRDNVRRYMETKDPASLIYILDHNEGLISIIDRTVITIQKHADHDLRVMGLIIASAIMIITGVIVAAMVRQVRRYRRAETRLAEIEQLLPICSSCKKIRTDNDHPENPRSWTSIDEYLRDKKDMVFTHSICPDCMMKIYPGVFNEEKKKD